MQGPKHGINYASAPIGNKVQGWKGGGQGVHDKEKGRETSAKDENHKQLTTETGGFLLKSLSKQAKKQSHMMDHP